MPQVYEASKFYFTVLMEDEATKVQTKYLRIAQPELFAPNNYFLLRKIKTKVAIPNRNG